MIWSIEVEVNNAGKLFAIFVLCLIAFQVGFSEDSVKVPFDVAAAEAKANQGDVAAMVKIGEAYFGKQGIPADADRCRVWLNRARNEP